MAEFRKAGHLDPDCLCHRGRESGEREGRQAVLGVGCREAIARGPAPSFERLQGRFHGELCPICRAALRGRSAFERG
ncbi:hypothetical protein ABTL06_19420, partial [Acinetobacter baumannii]